MTAAVWGMKNWHQQILQWQLTDYCSTEYETWMDTLISVIPWLPLLSLQTNSHCFLLGTMATNTVVSGIMLDHLHHHSDSSGDDGDPELCFPLSLQNPGHWLPTIILCFHFKTVVIIIIPKHPSPFFYHCNILLIVFNRKQLATVITAKARTPF